MDLTKELSKKINQPATTFLGNLLWVFLAVIFCIIILIFKIQPTPLLVPNEHIAESLPNLIAYNLASSLVIQYLFAKVSKRKTNSWRFFYTIIFLAALVVGDQVAYNKKQVTDFKQTVSELQNGEITQNTSRTHGLLGDFETIIKDSVQQSIALDNELQANFEAAGMSRILDPVRLKKDKNFVESNTMLEKFRQNIAQYGLKQNERLDNIRQRFSALPASEEDKKDFFDKYDKSAVEHKANIETIIHKYRLTIDEIKKSVDFLADKKHSWTVDNGRMLFSDEKTLAAFNAHLNKIQKLDKDSVDFRNQIIEQGKEKINQFVAKDLE